MSSQKQRRDLIIDKWHENTSATIKSIAKTLNMPKSTVQNVIARYKKTHSTSRKEGSGRKVGPIDPQLAKSIVKAFKTNPSRSVRFLANKFGVSKSYVQKVKKNNGLKSFKVLKAPSRDEKDEKKARSRARRLYERHMRGKSDCFIMDDETYCKANFRELPGSEFYVAKNRFGVLKKYRTQCLSKYCKKYLVWQAICACGKKSKIFVTSGTINGQIYRNECLKKRLLPFIRDHTSRGIKNILFWPDLASCHYSKETMKWYVDNKVNVVPRDANPQNSPELRPIERYWAIIKGYLKKGRRAAKNEREFSRFWHWATKKVPESVVKRMMEKVKRKVRVFGRIGLI